LKGEIVTHRGSP
jgi:Uma2 family endonuclease